jgi:hypothetical protein
VATVVAGLDHLRQRHQAKKDGHPERRILGHMDPILGVPLRAYCDAITGVQGRTGKEGDPMDLIVLGVHR